MIELTTLALPAGAVLTFLAALTLLAKNEGVRGAGRVLQGAGLVLAGLGIGFALPAGFTWAAWAIFAAGIINLATAINMSEIQ